MREAEKQQRHWVFFARWLKGCKRPTVLIINRARWDPAAKLAGIRRRNPYHTRHTFACWFLTAGANPSFIVAQMGHANA
ncbi:tyrosine-type recombinase/integrase [Serratia sp. OS31]|uniref:tyrosine-type recombinase/integrase n=1 Tax=Serratia sp. OS31 TaxID=2760844 RepID=UPI00351C6862